MRLTGVAVVVAVACGCVGGLSPASAAVPDDTSTSNTASEPTTRFGNTVSPREGETYHDGFLRLQRAYGSLGAVRMFYPGLPGSWSEIKTRVGATPVAVSFKVQPHDVLIGRYDRELREWFADAPTDRTTWWSYWHEPEDDIATDRISAEVYKLAWDHIATLADSVGNPKLRATLTLMCWTTNPHSGRTWSDYYAGDAVIDVLAFDCYNSGQRNGLYKSPRKMFEASNALADRVGKPWAVAELGSVIVPGDDGRGRATWLRRNARYLRAHNAVYCTYFDSDIGVDFRLHDRPSKTAWREIVTGQWG